MTVGSSVLYYEKMYFADGTACGFNLEGPDEVFPAAFTTLKSTWRLDGTTLTSTVTEYESGRTGEAPLAAFAIPGTAESPHFRLTSFRVGGRIFATAPTDDSFLHVFVPEEVRERWLALEPDALEKLFWVSGPRDLESCFEK